MYYWVLSAGRPSGGNGMALVGTRAFFPIIRLVQFKSTFV